jgi:hypothetical protein
MEEKGDVCSSIDEGIDGLFGITNENRKEKSVLVY